MPICFRTIVPFLILGMSSMQNTRLHLTQTPDGRDLENGTILNPVNNCTMSVIINHQLLIIIIKTMKKIATFVAIAATAVMMLSSCSGSGSGSDKGSLFGSLPSEYAEMMSARDALKEKAKEIKSEAEKAELIEKGKKLDEKWSKKLEESAKGLDGKEINLTDSIFKTTTPLTLTFEKLQGSDLEPSFKVNGSAETVEAITVENTYLTTQTVYIAGYDAEGTELFKSDVGRVTGTLTGTTLEIPAGTQVELGTLTFNDRYVDKYPEAKTLKLII